MSKRTREEEEIAAAVHAAEHDVSSDDESSSSSSSSESDDDFSDETPIVSVVPQRREQTDAADAGPSAAQNADASTTRDAGDTEIIDVEFEFFDPRESDFHALRQHLSSYLDGAEFDVGGLAALISDQVEVGTIVKSAGDTPELEHPIAFISVLNWRKHHTKRCMKQLRDYVLKRCSREECDGLNKLFDDESKNIGLVVQERLVNTPLELIPKLHQSLCDDLEWAAQKYGAEFQYDTLVWLERSDKTAKTIKQLSKKMKKKMKKRRKKNNANETTQASASTEAMNGVEFQRFEMDVYAKVYAVLAHTLTHWHTLFTLTHTHAHTHINAGFSLFCCCSVLSRMPSNV